MLGRVCSSDKSYKTGLLTVFLLHYCLQVRSIPEKIPTVVSAIECGADNQPFTADGLNLEMDFVLAHGDSHHHRRDLPTILS